MRERRFDWDEARRLHDERMDRKRPSWKDEWGWEVLAKVIGWGWSIAASAALIYGEYIGWI